MKIISKALEFNSLNLLLSENYTQKQKRFRLIKFSALAA